VSMIKKYKRGVQEGEMDNRRKLWREEAMSPALTNPTSKPPEKTRFWDRNSRRRSY